MKYEKNRTREKNATMLAVAHKSKKEMKTGVY